ncbi:hypothetical protein [Bifidobacterium mongoliense]|uniref:hypothetical protein n=1 Tax=Bifidobacterium mongoliense TaxID=518643 RepID=UPI0030EE5906
MRDGFWNDRAALAYVRDYARATRIAPMTLLLDVLARVSALTPPTVVIPPLVGASPASLNLFVATVGGPGTGKGLASAAAAQLIPDIRGAVTTQPASGEGLAAIYANRVPVTEEEGGHKGETRIHCVTSRALLRVEEIGVLAGASSRQGSTVTPTLCSAWSGEALGAFNKLEANRLTVPAHAYRLAMTVGVQPAASNALFANVGMGLPQRFIWSDTSDPDAPDVRPDRPTGVMPCDLTAIPQDPDPATFDAVYQAATIRGSLGYTLTEMRFPAEAYGESDRHRLAVLHGREVNPLDSHGMQCKAKTAALLALLDGRMDVSPSDWNLAGEIMAESNRVRDRCLELMHVEMQRQKADYISDSEEARAQAESRKLESAKRSVANYLTRHDPAHEGVKGYELRRPLGRNGGLAYDAIEALHDDGVLDCLVPGQDTSGGVWALTVGH